MLRRDRKVQYMVMEHYDENTGQEELDWQSCGNAFFDAVTIEQRRNERCQMTHAPKRYWKDMCGNGAAGPGEPLVRRSKMRKRPDQKQQL